MYATLNNDNVTMATEGTTTTHNMAAMTTGSTLTAAQMTAIPDSVANTINQLSTNQTPAVPPVPPLRPLGEGGGGRIIVSHGREI